MSDDKDERIEELETALRRIVSTVESNPVGIMDDGEWVIRQVYEHARHALETEES